MLTSSYVTIPDLDLIFVSTKERIIRKARAKYYISEDVHYIDQEGRGQIGEVIRSFHREDGEVLLLTNGHEVAIEQVVGVGRFRSYWGKLTITTPFTSPPKMLRHSMLRLLLLLLVEDMGSLPLR